MHSLKSALLSAGRFAAITTMAAAFAVSATIPAAAPAQAAIQPAEKAGEAPLNAFATQLAHWPSDEGGADAEAQHQGLRIATVNAQLIGESSGDLEARLENGGDEQAKKLAATVQNQRPDVLVLTGVDYDSAGTIMNILKERYFAVGQSGQEPINYEYSFGSEVNAGVDSGADLNKDGTVGGPEDAFGHGDYPGQGGMMVFSTHPIDTAKVRTFRSFPWQKLPGNSLAKTPFTGLQRKIMPLMSRSMWDIPVKVGKNKVHLVVTHLSPERELAGEHGEPLRHRDQLRFVRDYVAGKNYIRDDEGRRGGMKPGEKHVIVGQLNADPEISAEQKKFLAATADARWSFESSAAQNFFRLGRSRQATAMVDEAQHGLNGLRLNYVVPEPGAFSVEKAEVFWPTGTDDSQNYLPAAPIDGVNYRLVFADLKLH